MRVYRNEWQYGETVLVFIKTLHQMMFLIRSPILLLLYISKCSSNSSARTLTWIFPSDSWKYKGFPNAFMMTCIFLCGQYCFYQCITRRQKLAPFFCINTLLMRRYNNWVDTQVFVICFTIQGTKRVSSNPVSRHKKKRL